MDAIRVTKVENVKCSKAAVNTLGTLHLTAHHLIFRYDDPQEEEEMWVPYPLISLVLRLPLTLQGLYPLTVHCRTFESFSLTFSNEGETIDVFESVKELTVATSVTQLYAFFYTPNPPFPSKDGWSIYSPREEFGRMGVGTRTKAWRFTDINKDYSFCPSYPARLTVPTKISDTTLQYATKYRSKCRLPALTYLHWGNYASITRSSQPMVGITQHRSIQDEKLIEAIFQSHHSPESRASNIQVYGATATNLIIDARPTANAMANTAKGAGTENMDHYREGKKVYLGIDHIHVMRESLAKLVQALREADNVAVGMNGEVLEEVTGILDRQALRRSGWLRHITAILEGSVLIARNVHINSSHVLIHCSDGWDRTSQLSALSQLLLDPFYRTMRGFQILVEKDWLSFGYRFMDRCGHLSSERFFVSPTDTPASGGGTDAAQAFLASVQNRFASQHHIKETSPIFHQFLESVRQVQRQFPERFEFNQRFLKQLYYHLYSCQFGTFLYNCERERRIGDGAPPPCDITISVWDFFNSPSERAKNLNPLYNPALDDPMNRTPGADMGVLFPNPKDVRFWHELYGRSDEDMNGKVGTITQVRGVESLSLDDGAEDDPISRTDSPSSFSLSSSSLKPTPLSHSPSSIRAHSPRLTVARELSSSMPDITPRPGNSTPKQYPSSSTLSLQTQGASTSGSSNQSPASPNLLRFSKPAELFSSGGVKSVWGKLSVNASAAFTAVQEAYEGVAKDLKSLSGGDEDDEEQEKVAEMRSRDSLSTWGEPGENPGHRRLEETYTISASGNPWASVKRVPVAIVSTPFDNPWSSMRAPSPRSKASVGELFDEDTLTSNSNLATERNSTPDGWPLPLDTSHRDRASQKIAKTEPAEHPPSTDPLGVGL